MNTRFPSFKFAMGGRATTVAANVMFDSCLTDMHTCFKLVPLEHFRALALGQEGFGLDTELTASMLRAGIRPYEVPITYNGRDLTQGKKITWRDGFACLWILLTVRLRKPVSLPERPYELARVVVPLQPVVAQDERPDEELANAAT